MIRRRRPRYSELTSLLDVLFILLFASLIQAAGVVSAAERDREPPPRPPPQPEPRPVAASHTELRQRALDEIAESVRARAVVYAHVSPDGALRSVDHELDGELRALDIGAPLVERVADPDVGLAYLADRSPELRLCTRIRVILGLPDLDNRLVVVALAAPVADHPVALVDGLRADIDRCFADEGGIAVLIPPEAP